MMLLMTCMQARFLMLLISRNGHHHLNVYLSDLLNHAVDK